MLTWQQVGEMTDALCADIRQTGFRPNYIIAIARGGFVPARLIAGRLSVKRMGSVGISYLDASRTRREVYGRPVPVKTSDRILIVEDAIESGNSMCDAAGLLLPEAGEVKTSCYFMMPSSVMMPDYVLETRETLPAFPWDEC